MRFWTGLTFMFCKVANSAAMMRNYVEMPNLEAL